MTSCIVRMFFTGTRGDRRWVCVSQQLPILDSLKGFSHSFSCCLVDYSDYQEQCFIARGLGSCETSGKTLFEGKKLRLSTLNEHRAITEIYWSDFLPYWVGFFLLFPYQVFFPAYPWLELQSLTWCKQQLPKQELHPSRLSLISPLPSAIRLGCACWKYRAGLAAASLCFSEPLSPVTDCWFFILIQWGFSCYSFVKTLSAVTSFFPCCGFVVISEESALKSWFRFLRVQRFICFQDKPCDIPTGEYDQSLTQPWFSYALVCFPILYLILDYPDCSVVTCGRLNSAYFISSY